MDDIGRRGILKLMGSVPLAGLAATSASEAQDKPKPAAGTAPAKQKGKGFVPQFFTPHEYATVKVLVDLVIPADERSGSATEAGVPEFMDFMMVDPLVAPRDLRKRQTAMRGGLAWLDLECGDRFGKPFVGCAEAERKAILDDIAWPDDASPEFSQGAHFFSEFRDLTASGFWSTKTGIADLGYEGNTYVAEWKGCPAEVLKKLNLGDG